MQKKIEKARFDAFFKEKSTADLPEAPGKRFVSDAEKTCLEKTHGANSGDETYQSLRAKLGKASAQFDGWLSSEDFIVFAGKASQSALDLVASGLASLVSLFNAHAANISNPHKVTAAQIGILKKTKKASEARTSTALADDAELFLDLAAEKTYGVTLKIFAAGSATGGVKAAIAAANGLALAGFQGWGNVSSDQAVSLNLLNIVVAGLGVNIGAAGASNYFLRMDMTIEVGSAGRLVVRTAKNAAGGANVNILRGSSIVAVEI